MLVARIPSSNKIDQRKFEPACSSTCRPSYCWWSTAACWRTSGMLMLSTEVDSRRGGHSTGGLRPVATWPGQDGPPEETAVRGEEREDPKGRCPGQGTLQGVPQARQIPWRTWWRLWRTRQFKPWRTWAYHHQFWHSLPQVVMNGPFQINFFSPLVKIKFCCFC